MPVEWPGISVIIPYSEAARTIRESALSVVKSGYPNFELILVDDQSTDGSYEQVADLPAVHVVLLQRSGAAFARNVGVSASSNSILLFLDADVVLPSGILERIARHFGENPELAGVFGEYTSYTTHQNFASVYKNLIHHYTHEKSRKNALSFWSGCGAVRRSIFEEVGGFDTSYTAASVEDIAFGYEITSRGHKILLDKEIQVMHAKRYSLGSLIRSDVVDRAIPWTKLLVRKNMFHNDLNLRWPNIASAVVLILFFPMAIFAYFILPKEIGFYLIISVIALYLIINFPLYFFAVRKIKFYILPGFILMHLFTYLYSVIGFVIGFLGALLDGKKDPQK